MSFLPFALLFSIISTSVFCQEKQEDKETEATKKTALTTITIDRSKIDITAPVSLQSLQKDDINHYIDEKYIVPLLAGPDDFITLIHPNMAPNNKGVAILLPDWHQSATTPKSINFLRQSLPEQGWTTITILPPSKPDNFPSRALKKSQRTEEDKKTRETYLSSLSLLMKAVMEKARSYPGMVMVITEGNHAGFLMSLYQQDKNTAPSAFITLSSYMLTASANKQYNQNLADSDFPVLDLLLTKDHSQVLSNAAQRRALAEQALKPHYRQRKINNLTPSYYPQQDLLININGWLKSIGY